MDKSAILAFIESDLTKRESRFRARVAFVVFLSTACLGLWRYNFAQVPQANIQLWMGAIGLAAIGYVLVVGMLMDKVAHLLHPPAWPDDSSLALAAAQGRMLTTYGVGTYSKTVLLLEAVSRFTIAVTCFWFWRSAGSPGFVAAPVIIWAALGVVLSMFVALATMRSMRMLWRFVQWQMGMTSTPASTTGAHLTAKDVEENLRGIREAAERIRPAWSWKRKWRTIEGVARVGHFLALLGAMAVIFLGWAHASPPFELVPFSAAVMAIVVAVLASVWTIREIIAVVTPTDRPLLQQLLVVGLMGDRDATSIMRLYAVVVAGHEMGLATPDRLRKVIDDLKLDEIPLAGELVGQPVEQIAPADREPSQASARGG